jgi:uncharacterized protein YukE
VGLIRVEPEELRLAAGELQESARQLREVGRDLVSVARTAPSYDGQFGPAVRAAADSLRAEACQLASWLDELGGSLEAKAQAFQEADEVAVAGLTATGAQLRALVDEGTALPLMPIWLRRGRCPPWIAEEEWWDTSLARRGEILAEARQRWFEAQERRALLLTPPWEKDPAWLVGMAGVTPDAFRRLSIEERRSLTAETRAQYAAEWQRFLASQSMFQHGVATDQREAFLIYLYGLEGAQQHGVSINMPTDSPGRILADAEMGGLTSPGALAVQYFLSDNIVSLKPNIPRDRVLHNLCAYLSTGATLGMTANDALGQVAHLRNNEYPYLVEDGLAVLKNDVPVGPPYIRAQFESQGWDAHAIGYQSDLELWNPDGGSGAPRPERVQGMLDSGRGIIALVNLDVSEGRLTPTHVLDDAPHWVSIVQVLQTREGDDVIRVYNPFQDREEWYGWEDFRHAWEVPGEANYRAVYAAPPHVVAFLSPTTATEP